MCPYFSPHRQKGMHFVWETDLKILIFAKFRKKYQCSGFSGQNFPSYPTLFNGGVSIIAGGGGDVGGNTADGLFNKSVCRFGGPKYIGTRSLLGNEYN